MPRIWIDYLEHLTASPKITKTRRAFDKALRALPITQHIRIWGLYLAWAKKIGGETALKVYKRYLKVPVRSTVSSFLRTMALDGYRNSKKADLTLFSFLVA